MAEHVTLDTANKIINVAYPNNAADLIWANPLGPVSGYELNDNSNNQKWVFRQGAAGGVAFESVAAPGTFASTYVEDKGAPIVGRTENTGWAIAPVSGAENIYWIATVDRKYVWSLDDSSNFFTILLRPAEPDPGPQAYWKLS